MRAWERAAIVWGRPPAAMACTDIQAVLDGLAARPDADLKQVRLLSRGSGDLAMAGLFAAALDPRIAALDLDLAGACYERGNLAPLPFVLWHGEVLQWAALAADRALTLRNVSKAAGDPTWLAQVFDLMGDRQRLEVVPE
jgi:hypothetical protein